MPRRGLDVESKGVNSMRNLIALLYRLFACKFKGAVLAAGLSLFMAYSVAAMVVIRLDPCTALEGMWEW